MSVISFLNRACAGPAVVMILLGGLPAVAAHAAETSYSILHSFHGEESNPQAALTSDGHRNLYGTTINGGGSDYGTVFTVRADGTGFQRLHTFAGANDGFTPAAPLILDGLGNLFGTTSQGGPSGGGTLFTIRVDGGGFLVLHSFAGGASDGEGPSAALALDGAGNLYGTTRDGGSSNFGTVFRLRTDGTGFQLLHSFAGGPSDGRAPSASLLLDGSGNLYGTTVAGGQPAAFNPFGDINDGAGTVFRIKTDGTGYQLLRAFPMDANDAAYPSGSLITDGSGNLYGMTVNGGSSDAGTVFRIGMNGSGFLNLHSFAGGSSDGRYPVGSLVLDRLGNLYGMTLGEGLAGLQMIFKVMTDGTGYQVLYTFIDLNEGYAPAGSLILEGSDTLFGAMTYGGTSDAGTVFNVKTDGSVFQVLYAFVGFMNDGSRPLSPVISDGSGYLYGTTANGGLSNGGTVFRIRSNGNGFELLHTFIGGADDGSEPDAPLILDRAGNLYGTTNLGGVSNGGTVFKMRMDGTGLQILHSFHGGAEDGRNPAAALVLDGADDLYGTTPYGGPADAGTVFRITTDGTGFQILHAFTFAVSNDGAAPYCSLLLDGSGNLYGTTLVGGSGLWGTVFKLRTDGTGFQLLHSFTGGSGDGGELHASLIIDGSGNLYGTTARGGSLDVGTVFRMKTDGTSFRLLHSFADNAGDGATPYAPVSLDRFGNLYGTTWGGGPSDLGTVFTVRTDGTAFRVLHVFGEASDGQNPPASLFLDGSGNLIGTTVGGGVGNFGTVFALSLGRHHPVVAPGPFAPVRRN